MASKHAISVSKIGGRGAPFHALPVGQQIARITMSNAVVLITGALTGIGRAAALAFAKRGAKVVVAGRRDDAGKALVRSYALSVLRPSSSTPTSARTKTSALWSTRPSHGLAVSMSQ